MSNKPLKIYHNVHFVFGDLPEAPIPSRRELVNGALEQAALVADDHMRLGSGWDRATADSIRHAIRALKESSPR